jgi:hypothetical protein
MSPPVLQPELKIGLEALVKSLPALAYWAARTPNQPKPLPEEFVKPGRTDQSQQPANLAAPPTLTIPSRESILSELSLAGAPSPGGLVPPSTTAPVRDSAGVPRAGSLNSVNGQAANIIVLSDERAKPDQDIAAPRDVRNIPNSGSKGGGLGLVTRPAATASATSRASRPEIAMFVPGGWVETPSSMRPAITRIKHPANGNFDVVVMQALPADDEPRSRTLLSGSPIYTVYLEVGDKKLWLLEFCAPGNARESSATDIYIDGGDAGLHLTPPYPISTAIPGNLAGGRAKPAMIHGYLTKSGLFRDLEPRDAGVALVAALNPLLSGWRFRPAARNKVPMEVEVLLVIPAAAE